MTHFHYCLNLYTTQHEEYDGDFVLQHLWTYKSGDAWSPMPGPPILQAGRDGFSILFHPNGADISASPQLHLTTGSPIGVIEDLAGSESQGLYGFPSAEGGWVPEQKGTFSFSALIKTAVGTTSSQLRTYKADPETVVSSHGEEPRPWDRVR